jgi:hypothetical protein
MKPPGSAVRHLLVHGDAMNYAHQCVTALVTLALAVGASACATSTEEPVGLEIEAEVRKAPEPWSSESGSRIMRELGSSVEATEGIECRALNGTATPLMLGECRMQITNGNCQTPWSEALGEYVCLCVETVGGAGC